MAVRTYAAGFDLSQNCVVPGFVKLRVNRRVPTMSVRVAGSETRKSSFRYEMTVTRGATVSKRDACGVTFGPVATRRVSRSAT